MKKSFLLHRIAAVCAMAIVLLPLVSCAATASATLSGKRLWNLNLGNDFSRTQVSRYVTWYGVDANKGMKLVFEISPGSKRSKEPQDITLHVGGTEYSVRDGKVDRSFVIGREVMTGYLRTLYWEREGCLYTLCVSAGEDETKVDIVSPETAEILEKSLLSSVAGFELVNDRWLVKFAGKEVAGIAISLHSLQANEIVLRDILETWDYKKEYSEDIEYYASSFSYPDGIIRGIIWNTDAGLLELNSIRPQRDSGDFINQDLIRNITEQIGAKIIPMPEKTSKP